MAKLAALVGVIVLGGTAAAGPTTRFGVTFGTDRDADIPLLGPAVAVGERFGPFVAEVEWAWLSFLDGLVSQGGVQRLGVTLRADVARRFGQCLHADRPDLFACTHARSLYIEGGAAERFGQFMTTGVPEPRGTRRPEVHLGAGIELDNAVGVSRNGWQLGVRVALAHNDALAGVSCRGATGSCMTTSAVPAGTDIGVLVEWMYFLGR